MWFLRDWLLESCLELFLLPSLVVIVILVVFGWGRARWSIVKAGLFCRECGEALPDPGVAERCRRCGFGHDRWGNITDEPPVDVNTLRPDLSRFDERPGTH